MYRGRRVLGVICARGGSKGLPRKNVLNLGGRPLIAWSVEAAGQSELLDRAVVSTDDPEIAEAARAAGGDAPFLRPDELASDTARVTDAVIHAYRSLGEPYDVLVLLQAASPFRTGGDIDDTVRTLIDGGGESAVTVTRQLKSPALFVTIDGKGRIVPGEATGLQQRRQDHREYFAPNGMVYATLTDYLCRTGSVYADHTLAVVIPPERAIDIDTAFDLRVARGLLAVD